MGSRNQPKNSPRDALRSFLSLSFERSILRHLLTAGYKLQNMSDITRTEVGIAAPLFIVRSVPKTLAFYRDELGFDVTFEGPEPNDIFFGIVERGRAMIMFKAVGVEPVPNCTRDVGQGIASWDAYIYIPDPDTLYDEFLARNVDFKMQLCNNSDNLRGFEVRDINGYIIYFGRPLTD